MIAIDRQAARGLVPVHLRRTAFNSSVLTAAQGTFLSMRSPKASLTTLPCEAVLRLPVLYLLSERNLAGAARWSCCLFWALHHRL